MYCCVLVDLFLQKDLPQVYLVVSALRHILLRLRQICEVLASVNLEKDAHQTVPAHVLVSPHRLARFAANFTRSMLLADVLV